MIHHYDADRDQWLDFDSEEQREVYYAGVSKESSETIADEVTVTIRGRMSSRVTVTLG